MNSVFFYLLVAIDAEEVNIKVNIQFFGKRPHFLTYSTLCQSVNFFVENIVIYYTHAEKLK